MSDDSNPNSLTRPKVKVTKLSNKLLYIIIAVLVGLLLFLVMEVDRSTTKTQEVRQAQEEPAPPDNKPPVVNTGRSVGLATSKPSTEEKTNAKEELESRQIIIVPTTTKNPALEQKKKELTALRQMKWQQEQEAFRAPLRKSKPLPKLEKTSTPAATSLQTIQADVLSRHPLSASAGVMPPNAGSYDPAIQKDKEAFLNTRSASASKWELQHSRTKGKPFELKTGSLIPGVMLTGINSDLPGQLIGQVSQNVYDSASGEYLLIPQGSRMIGVYDSRVVAGQSRVLIAWNRIIFPDGSSITLGTMPGTDMAGYSGLSDETNNHYFKVFGSAAIMSLISGSTSYAADSLSSDTAQNQKPSLQDELGSALSSQLGQAGLQVLQRNLNIQPTLTIRPGYRFNMVTTKDIVFRQPYTEWR